MAEDKGGFIAVLYEKYYANVYKLCCARLGYNSEDAKDCAQEVFLAALKKQARLKKHPDPERWLYKAASIQIKRRLRKYKVEERYIKLHPPEENCRFEELFAPYAITDSEIASIKRELIDLLCESERELYLMRYEDKLSIEDISLRLGRSPEAVKMRIFRLNVKLHELAQNVFMG